MPLLEDVGYQVSVLSLNPTELGEPVNRPRIYFVGVRSDVAKLSKEPSQLFYKHIWSHLTQKRLHRNKCEFGSSLVPLWCRLLPDDSDLVAAKRQERMQKWEDAKQLAFLTSEAKQSGGRGTRLGQQVKNSKPLLREIFSGQSYLLTNFIYTCRGSVMPGGA